MAIRSFAFPRYVYCAAGLEASGEEEAGGGLDRGEERREEERWYAAFATLYVVVRCLGRWMGDVLARMFCKACMQG